VSFCPLFLTLFFFGAMDISSVFEIDDDDDDDDVDDDDASVEVFTEVPLTFAFARRMLRSFRMLSTSIRKTERNSADIFL